MEPTTTLSAMLGLLAQFVQERRAGKDAQRQATLDEYREWLRRGEHTQVLGAIEGNEALLAAIRELLHAGHQEIIERLGRLDQTLGSVLEHTTGWELIARSLNPTDRLSDQALAILTQMEAKEATFVQEVLHCGGTPRILFCDCGAFDVDEPRFLDDDLEQLLRLRLLAGMGTSQGSQRFVITRLGSEVARHALTRQTEQQNDGPPVGGPSR